MSFKQEQSVNKPVKPTSAAIVAVVVAVVLSGVSLVAYSQFNRSLDNSPAKMACFIISNFLLILDTLDNLQKDYREGARNDNGSRNWKRTAHFIILISLFGVYILFFNSGCTSVLEHVSVPFWEKGSFDFAYLYDSMAITTMGILISVLTSRPITRAQKLIASLDDETPSATRPPVDSRR